MWRSQRTRGIPQPLCCAVVRLQRCSAIRVCVRISITECIPRGRGALTGWKSPCAFAGSAYRRRQFYSSAMSSRKLVLSLYGCSYSPNGLVGQCRGVRRFLQEGGEHLGCNRASAGKYASATKRSFAGDSPCQQSTFAMARFTQRALRLQGT